MRQSRFVIAIIAFVASACGGLGIGDGQTPFASGGNASPGGGGTTFMAGGAFGNGGTIGVGGGGAFATGGWVGAGGIIGPGGLPIGGTDSGIAVAPAGGSTGIGGTPSAGGAFDAGAGAAPATYPPLDFASIGRPASIRSNFLFTEGPVWAPAEQALFFTDINADTIYRLTLPSTIDAFLTPMGKSNGLSVDPQGNLIGAGFVSRDVWRLVGNTVQTLASSYQGKKLNSPDDLCARSDGIIYFTDPVFGISGSQGLSAQTQELGFQGVYRITTDGTLHLEDQTTTDPNGVQLSPDEKTLYVSYTAAGRVDAFAVGSDGALSGRKTFASNVSLADSMCVDAGGNVYVAVLGGVAVLSPTGARLGTIALTQTPTNCAFGGPQMNTMFITARTALLGTPTAGNSSIYRIDNMPIPGIAGK